MIGLPKTDFYVVHPDPFDQMTKIFQNISPPPFSALLMTWIIHATSLPQMQGVRGEAV